MAFRERDIARLHVQTPGSENLRQGRERIALKLPAALFHP